MKKFLAPIFSLLVGCSSAFATGFSLTSSESVAYTDAYIKGTGGQLSVFLVSSLEDGATLDFSTELQDSLYQMKWYTYTENVENLTDVTSGIVTKAGKSVLSNPKTDIGYAVEYSDKDGNKYQYYVWLTKFLPISSADVDTTQYYCDRLPIHLSPVLTYRTIYGNVSTVRRAEEVSFSVFEMQHGQKVESKTEYVNGDSVVYIPAVPTVDTPFEFVNSNFGTSFTTDTFYTYAVNAFPVMTTNVNFETEVQHGTLEKDARGSAVLYFGEPGVFRTSSPFSVNFKSNRSPKADSFVWYFAKDSTFKNARIYRTESWRDTIGNYKGLNTLGKHCIKYEVSNKKSGCSYSSMACFEIDTSRLYVPNVIIPNSSDEKVSKFRVYYSSIKSYECRIYNQWGRLVFESSDVREAWDGSFNGHELPSGVYFAVINAEGYDGQVFKRKVTISLIRKED